MVLLVCKDETMPVFFDVVAKRVDSTQCSLSLRFVYIEPQCTRSWRQNTTSLGSR